LLYNTLNWYRGNVIRDLTKAFLTSDINPLIDGHMYSVPKYYFPTGFGSIFNLPDSIEYINSLAFGHS